MSKTAISKVDYQERKVEHARAALQNEVAALNQVKLQFLLDRGWEASRVSRSGKWFDRDLVFRHPKNLDKFFTLNYAYAAEKKREVAKIRRGGTP